jgi:hypothetical protein
MAENEFPYMKSHEDGGEEQRTRTTGDSMTENSSSLPEPIPISSLSSSLRECASLLGFAPRLRQVVSVPGSWSTVVVDESKFEPLYGMVLSADQQDKVRDKLSQVVNKLHDGLVHGDIRGTDVLIDVAPASRLSPIT